MKITADLLRYERQNAVSVKFEEFMRVFSKHRSSLICFFEGYDQLYYHSRIDNRIDGNKAYINCCGKQQVLELFRRISRHLYYKDAKTAFFIDKDFDDSIPETLKTDVYETPGYSIENFYVTLSAFENILDNVFKINKFSMNEDDVKIHKTCLKLYKSTQKKFHKKVTLLNMYILVLRKNKILEKTKHSLKDLKLNSLVKIDLDNIRKNYDLDTLNDIFSTAKNITNEEISAQKLPPLTKQVSQFRGKFEIEFFHRFLTLLKQELCLQSSTHFSKKKRISYNIPSSIDQLLNDLSQWADTPVCLTKYLSLINIKYSAKND